jgi:cephalosporin hydroxylase
VEEFQKAVFWRAGQLWGNNTWAGVNALKAPWDIWIAQEILWETRPDLVAETGVHGGGSTLFYAQMLDSSGTARCSRSTSTSRPSTRGCPSIRG